MVDVFLPIVIVVIAFAVFSVCGWCFKRKRGTTLRTNTPGGQPQHQLHHHHHNHHQVSVGGASPQIVPPYPIDLRHQPQPMVGAPPPPPAPGFAVVGGAPYPTIPCQQPPQAPGFYYQPPYHPAAPPLAAGYQQQGQQPHYGAGTFTAPPSYTEATMGQQQTAPYPPVAMATTTTTSTTTNNNNKEIYGKQAPYNPHY